jgi:hypothetical protein
VTVEAPPKRSRVPLWTFVALVLAALLLAWLTFAPPPGIGQLNAPG